MLARFPIFRSEFYLKSRATFPLSPTCAKSPSRLPPGAIASSSPCLRASTHSSWTHSYSGHIHILNTFIFGTNSDMLNISIQSLTFIESQPAIQTFSFRHCNEYKLSFLISNLWKAPVTSLSEKCSTFWAPELVPIYIFKIRVEKHSEGFQEVFIFYFPTCFIPLSCLARDNAAHVLQKHPAPRQQRQKPIQCQVMK